MRGLHFSVYSGAQIISVISNLYFRLQVKSSFGPTYELTCDNNANSQWGGGAQRQFFVKNEKAKFWIFVKNAVARRPPTGGGHFGANFQIGTKANFKIGNFKIGTKSEQKRISVEISRILKSGQKLSQSLPKRIVFFGSE